MKSHIIQGIPTNRNVLCLVFFPANQKTAYARTLSSQRSRIPGTGQSVAPTHPSPFGVFPSYAHRLRLWQSPRPAETREKRERWLSIFDPGGGHGLLKATHHKEH